MVTTIAAAGLVAVWPVAAMRLEAVSAYGPPALKAPLATEDWKQVTERLTDWTPHFLGSSVQVNQAFGKEGTRIGLYIGYYRNQRQGAKLITTQNTLVVSNDREWKNIGEIRRTPGFTLGEISAIETKLRGQSTSLLVWRWYWVDGQYIVNPYWGKLLQAKSRLLGRGDDAAIVIVYAPYDERPQDAEQALRDFVGTMLPAITRSLEYARRVQP